MVVAAGSLEERIVESIRRDGPLRFDRLMDRALYDPDHGFFATAGGAGRADGDFITSPEVGPLFGAVVARALDTWWDELGRPDPFTVVEAGAGRGALARSILAAAPACGAALRYVAVERSARLRAEHPDHPAVRTAASMPDPPLAGVVLANELLDNLPVRLLERDGGGWREVHVDVDADGRLVEVLLDADPAAVEVVAALADDPPAGARVPFHEAARAWLVDALAILERGRLVVIDYGDTTANLARRPASEWLRTYRRHGRGGPVLADLGEQDVTCEVAFDQLATVARPAQRTTQAELLAAHGIHDLVEEGRRTWQARAHLGDLEALRARSRISEAEALLDRRGLGAFTVLQWVVPSPPDGQRG